MPRDGSGQYYHQPGTEAVTGEVIRADQFNQRFEDVKNDLNAARPVAVGGTGATDATTARANLGAASHTALTALENRVTPINRGGTGAATAAAARTSLGVPHVDGAATITGTWTYSQAALQVFPSDGAGTVTTHRWNIGADWTWTLRHWANGDLEFNRQAGGGVFKVSGAEVWTTANLTPTPAGIGAVPTARTVTAGDGLTGGGNLTADRSLSVDSTVVRTSGDQTIHGEKTFTSPVIAASSFYSYATTNANIHIRFHDNSKTGPERALIWADTARKLNFRVADGSGVPQATMTLSQDGIVTAPAFLGDGSALTNLPVLGVGQAWQNVTASRSGGTVYQNTTGRPIELAIIGASNPVGEGALQVRRGAGGTWITIGSLRDPSLGGGSISAVIPAGDYYRLSTAAIITVWSELR